MLIFSLTYFWYWQFYRHFSVKVVLGNSKGKFSADWFSILILHINQFKSRITFQRQEGNPHFVFAFFTQTGSLAIVRPLFFKGWITFLGIVCRGVWSPLSKSIPPFRYSPFCENLYPPVLITTRIDQMRP